MRASFLGWTSAALALLAAPAWAEESSVCVEVEVVGPATEEGPAVLKLLESAAPGHKVQLEDAPLAPLLPIGQDPVGYLKRLLEHYVTHASGWQAVQTGCQEHLRVELYPLAEGWTAFARFTKTGREERVDQLFPDELSQFAERAVAALLEDHPISGTILRDTVLRSDSERSFQRVRGTHHYSLNVGTQLRGGQFDTLVSGGGTENQVRLMYPVVLSTGYRGKFESWCVEAQLQGLVGTSQEAAISNAGGGHVDFSGGLGLQLHFAHYFNPRGLDSFYLGAGSTFELLWFSVIRPAGDRHADDRSTLLGGGLDVDVVFGWEFMRASSVQFYLQGELVLPAFALDTGDDYGGEIHTWYPGLALKLGVVF
ncbi:MAG TPA: hypothetical protein PK668_27810 [Myxococcota bacterium]|nr:hypothetical protein [Myxococcota bacterium]HRY97299.1 hypothetical protein [Myxococcota bacterium]